MPEHAFTPRDVFVDTSAWLAIYNPRDKYATQASNFLSQHPSLFTSNFVVDELLTLARNRAGHRVAVQIGDDLWSGRLAKLVHVTQADEQVAWSLFKKYDDKNLSFTDCTSFAVMLRLGLAEAFTFDDDFIQVGLFMKVP